MGGKPTRRNFAGVFVHFLIDRTPLRRRQFECRRAAAPSTPINRSGNQVLQVHIGLNIVRQRIELDRRRHVGTSTTSSSTPVSLAARRADVPEPIFIPISRTRSKNVAIWRVTRCDKLDTRSYTATPRTPRPAEPAGEPSRDEPARTAPRSGRPSSASASSKCHTPRPKCVLLR
jgi:hypothetical protein